MKRLIVHAVLAAAALCASAASAADVAWPSDFNEKLAARIAAIKSEYTTSGYADVASVEPCRRTSASFDFAVVRTPPVKRGSVFIIR